MKSYFTTKKIALMAVFTALTTVVTVFLRIPMVSTNGYINFGDAIIFITGALMGPIPASTVGGIGSAIADLVGYPIWAPFTFIIKALEGFICGLICKVLVRENYNYLLNAFIGLFSMLIASLWMVIAYFFAGWILSGYGGAVESFVGNLIQGGVSVAVAMGLVYLTNLPYVAKRMGVTDTWNMQISKKKNKDDTNKDE